MEMRNLVLCVLFKFEEPVKQKIPESGVQGVVGVGVEVLEVIISTLWVFKSRKLRSVLTEEESEDWAGLQATGRQWGPTDDMRTSRERGARMSGPGS